jgi:hypothetical protein
MELDPAYFSHIPLLSAAMTITSGPVLELGAGLGSTLLLHGLCGSMNRNLVTIESDESWLKQFIVYSRSWHRFRFVKDFADILEYNQKWGLVFIDHGISKQRGISLERLKESNIIICHDTCYFWLYDYEPTLSNFKYRFDYRIAYPKTTIVSNFVNVIDVFEKFNL